MVSHSGLITVMQRAARKAAPRIRRDFGEVEQLQIIPLLVVTPLTFLGGAFYSIEMLGEPWRTITLFNPVVYLINGFRWTFFGTADVAVGASLAATLGFFCLCLAAVAWIFRTGYRLKS